MCANVVLKRKTFLVGKSEISNRSTEHRTEQASGEQEGIQPSANRTSFWAPVQTQWNGPVRVFRVCRNSRRTSDELNSVHCGKSTPQPSHRLPNGAGCGVNGVHWWKNIDCNTVAPTSTSAEHAEHHESSKCSFHRAVVSRLFLTRDKSLASRPCLVRPLGAPDWMRTCPSRQLALSVGSIHGSSADDIKRVWHFRAFLFEKNCARQTWTVKLLKNRPVKSSESSELMCVVDISNKLCPQRAHCTHKCLTPHSMHLSRSNVLWQQAGFLNIDSSTETRQQQRY